MPGEIAETSEHGDERTNQEAYLPLGAWQRGQPAHSPIRLNPASTVPP